MANRGTIRSQVLNLVASNSMITSANVNDIIDAEHDTILNDYSWTRRRIDTMVETVSAYSTGTLSTSDATVTGSSTVWTAAFVGRYIRIGSNTFFHRITARASDTSISIEEALPSA